MEKSKNKKIIIATGIFPPDSGGPATYVTFLASELKKEGKDVVVITYADSLGSGSSDDNFKAIRIARQQNILGRYFKYFRAVLKEADSSSVVYAQDPISSGVPAWLASYLKGSKFILKVVGDYAWEQGNSRFGVSDSIEDFQNKSYGFFVSLMKLLERFVAKRASAVVVPSKYLKSIVLKWRVSDEKIKVIYNSYAPQHDVVCEDTKTEKDTLVSVGRLVPWKGFAELIEIMPDLLRENPNFVLHIVDDGPERKNIEEKIKSLNLESKVLLLGRISKKDVFCELKKAKMFILNTSYEGLSHLLLEAMDAGTPIVTTDVGGNPEVITNGESGILIEKNNKEELKNEILRLYKDENLKNRLTENAKNSLGNFTQEKMIRETVEVLFAS